MKVVGLTGGIGSGKSAVASIFEELGVGVIDTDQIAHRLTALGGQAIASITAAFGANVITEDGAMDRHKMRALAFADAAVKLQLESILHPMIREEVAAALHACEQKNNGQRGYVMLAVPLLFERMTFVSQLWRTIAVDCAEASQIARVVVRSALSHEQVAAIMANQLPRRVRLQLADDVIHNQFDIANLRAQVNALNHRYTAAS